MRPELARLLADSTGIERCGEEHSGEASCGDRVHEPVER